MSALLAGRPGAAIAVLDRPAPLFPYALPRHDAFVRTFEPYIVTLMDDDEAWEALFADKPCERDAWPWLPLSLVTFKVCYGNRNGKRRKR